MRYRARRRRPMYLDVHLPRRLRALLIFILIFVALSAFLLQSVLYLRELSCSMALSDATDLMVICVNGAISDKMARGNYDTDYFVELERDGEGRIAAVTANMSRINTLSAELLQDVVNASNGGSLSINIPLGNLLGSSLLLGKGPDVPVEISMLTSSRVDCKNELIAAGINQTKHQIKLDVVVDIDVILPWKTVSTEVVSEILIAETVIVGQVPQTLFDMG